MSVKVKKILNNSTEITSNEGDVSCLNRIFNV
jgi:hypothetical protein